MGMVGREQRTENEASYPIVRMIIPGLNSPKIPSVSDFLRALGPADGAGHQLPLAPGSGHPDIALCRPPVVGKESQQTQNSSSPLTPPTHTHTHTQMMILCDHEGESSLLVCMVQFIHTSSIV